MRGSFVVDVFYLWVDSFVLRLGAVEVAARLSGGACGAAVVFFFVGAIEGCFTCWNGGRRCWDLCFLDAQTGSINSMKMTMKIGT